VRHSRVGLDTRPPRPSGKRPTEPFAGRDQLNVARGNASLCGVSIDFTAEARRHGEIRASAPHRLRASASRR